MTLHLLKDGVLGRRLGSPCQRFRGRTGERCCHTGDILYPNSEGADELLHEVQGVRCDSSFCNCDREEFDLK